MSSNNWQDPDSDLSVRKQIVSWMIFDGETCLYSFGVFRDPAEAIAVAKWWARRGFPEIKRRRATA